MSGYGNILYEPVVTPPIGATNPTGVYNQQVAGGGTMGQTSVVDPVTGVAAPSNATLLGPNIGTGQLALGAIGTIGNLWAAWQAQKLAKEQFNFQKGITNTNLANQIQTYNTALNGLAESRGYMQGDSADQTATYVEENQLRDRRNG